MNAPVLWKGTGAKTKEINLLSDTQTTSVTTDVAMLDSLDPGAREVAVTSMLDQARQWLERAKESTVPAQDVAEFKAFVATVAEAAKQKKLSEDIQLDAIEMVRRSERALGVAIRQGQAAGSIRRAGFNPNPPGAGATASAQDADGKQSPEDFFTSGQAKSDAYAVTDDVSDAEFEEAVTAAKEEGNLSRANVVSKVQSLSAYKETHNERWATITQMAADGYHSAQIAKSVGMSEQGVRKGARDKGIEIRADKVLGNVRRIDPLFVIEQIVLGLEVTETSLELVSYEDVTPEQAAEWLERLASPLRAIRAMQSHMKEIN
jgi:hypothetical protein